MLRFVGLCYECSDQEPLPLPVHLLLDTGPALRAPQWDRHLHIQPSLQTVHRSHLWECVCRGGGGVRLWVGYGLSHNRPLLSARRVQALSLGGLWQRGLLQQLFLQRTECGVSRENRLAIEYTNMGVSCYTLCCRGL